MLHITSALTSPRWLNIDTKDTPTGYRTIKIMWFVSCVMSHDTSVMWPCSCVNCHVNCTVCHVTKLQIVSCVLSWAYMWHVPCSESCVLGPMSCHMWHVTGFMWPCVICVTCNKTYYDIMYWVIWTVSCVLCHRTWVICHVTCHVFHDVCHVTYVMLTVSHHVSCDFTQVSFISCHITCDMQRVMWSVTLSAQHHKVCHMSFFMCHVFYIICPVSWFCYVMLSDLCHVMWYMICDMCHLSSFESCFLWRATCFICQVSCAWNWVVWNVMKCPV